MWGLATQGCVGLRPRPCFARGLGKLRLLRRPSKARRGWALRAGGATPHGLAKLGGLYGGSKLPGLLGFARAPNYLNPGGHERIEYNNGRLSKGPALIIMVVEILTLPVIVD